MSDSIKYQKKTLKQIKESMKSIETDVLSLFESVKDNYTGDLSYIADKLKDIQDYLKADNKTKYITEAVNVNADWRNTVNNFIVKYQNKNITEQLISEFFNDCYNKLSLAVHPDESFSDYVDDSGKRVFMSPEAKQLDMIMDDMFTWCDKQGIDIYNIGMEHHPSTENGLGSDFELEETVDPEVPADQYEYEQEILNSDDYKRAYDEFMRWESNDDELTKEAAHKYALDFTKEAKENYGELNELDIEGPGPDVENELDPEDEINNDIDWVKTNVVDGKPVFTANFNGLQLEISPSEKDPNSIICWVGLNAVKRVLSYSQAYKFFEHEWNSEYDEFNG